VLLNVSLHAGAEEQVFYPALDDAGDEAGAEANVAAHQPVKEALGVIDRHPAGDEEDAQLPWLRERLGDGGMVELGEVR
jgi:hypothetical protein